MRYLTQIFLSFSFSLFFAVLIGFFTNNVVAGISTLAALLVSIQFFLTRYENRLDTLVKVSFINGSNQEKIRIEITNIGGKTIYLKSEGIETSDGLIIDFDDEIKREVKKEEGKKDLIFNIPDVSYLVDKPSFSFPIKSVVQESLHPGQSYSRSRKIFEIIEILIQKGWEIDSRLVFKGYFKDQLNNVFYSDAEIFNIEEYFNRFSKKN